jgi:hypothetical protein
MALIARGRLQSAGYGLACQGGRLNQSEKRSTEQPTAGCHASLCPPNMDRTRSGFWPTLSMSATNRGLRKARAGSMHGARRLARMWSPPRMPLTLPLLSGSPAPTTSALSSKAAVTAISARPPQDCRRCPPVDTPTGPWNRVDDRDERGVDSDLSAPDGDHQAGVRRGRSRSYSTV